MKISEQHVRKVASLARLSLTEEEVQTFTGQLDAILGYIEQLGELDTSAVEPTSHAVPLACPLREDIVVPSFPAGELLRRAPAQEGGFFRVPRIIE